MADLATILANQGYVSARDPADFAPGELQTAKACWYKPGDLSRVWQQLGPSTFDDIGTGAIKGVGLLTFDNDTELVVAYMGNTLYEATAGLAGTFTDLITGLDASATRHSIVHSRDAWFWHNGYDRGRVIFNDKSTINHGMFPPVVALVATAGSTAAGTTSPASDTGTFTNSGYARDGDDTTFAGALLQAAGSVVEVWTFTSDTYSGERLDIRWGLGNLIGGNWGGPGTWYGNVGEGGSLDSGFDVTVKIEVDDGGYTPVYEERRTVITGGPVLTQVPIADGGPKVINVRVTLTYHDGQAPANLRVKEITAIETGGVGANFSTENNGLYYSYSELDQTHGIASPVAPLTGPVTLSSQNFVTLSGFPTTARNSNTTHYIVYRTTDTKTAEEGVVEELGRIAMLPIANASDGFIDDFNEYDKDTQPIQLFPMVTISQRGGEVRVPQDSPPPSFAFIDTFKGRLVGIARTNPRGFYGSFAGRPHSWPALNLIDAFPFPDNDQLVAGAELGDNYVIGAKGLMLILTDFPSVIAGGGAFSAAETRPLKGQPGLTSQYGITAYSVAGEDRVAWVSRNGIRATNGVQAWPLTRDLDWSSEVTQDRLSSAVLRWDEDRQVLVFNADTNDDGTNDTEFLLHMAPEHQKENGQPKIVKTPSKGRTDYVYGEVASTPRLYSGDTANGQVYVEEAGTGDTTFEFKTGKIYFQDDYYKINMGSLRHTDWGTGKTGVLTWGVGFDDSGDTKSITNTVSLAGADGERLLIGHMAEWSEVSFASTDTGGGAIHDLRMRVMPMGKAGAAS